MTGLQRSKPLGRGKPLERTAGLASVTPLHAHAPLQRHARLSPVSSARRAENRRRAAMIAELAGGERPLCAVWVLLQPEWCTRRADDAHEPLTRARLGSITDPGNCCFVCRPCHDVLTFTPESQLAWAYRLGLLRHDQLCCRDQAPCVKYDSEGAA